MTDDSTGGAGRTGAGSYSPCHEGLWAHVSR